MEKSCAVNQRKRCFTANSKIKIQNAKFRKLLYNYILKIKFESAAKQRGEPGELKHLSNPRKRERNSIPKVAASDPSSSEEKLVKCLVS